MDEGSNPVYVGEKRYAHASGRTALISITIHKEGVAAAIGAIGLLRSFTDSKPAAAWNN
jgi:hypothetical protein